MSTKSAQSRVGDKIRSRLSREWTTEQIMADLDCTRRYVNAIRNKKKAKEQEIKFPTVVVAVDYYHGQRYDVLPDGRSFEVQRKPYCPPV